MGLCMMYSSEVGTNDLCKEPEMSKYNLKNKIDMGTYGRNDSYIKKLKLIYMILKRGWE